MTSTTSAAVGERLMRFSEFAEIFGKELGISERTIDRWVRARVIPSIKVGRLRFIDPVKARAALERFERRSLDIERRRAPSHGQRKPKISQKLP